METRILKFLTFLIYFFHLHSKGTAAPVGVCYSRAATNLPPTSAVVSLLKSNGITRVRIYRPDPETLTAFKGTEIELLIGVPNEQLAALANSTAVAAASWLQSNILSAVDPSQVPYLAVGNDVLLKDPNLTPYLVPAVLNLYGALQRLGLENTIKLSSPVGAAVMSAAYPPSSAAFDLNQAAAIVPLLQFLRDTDSPLMVNVYPFYSYVGNPKSLTLDYALFRSSTIEIDQNLGYTNMFDATIDAFVYAMEREGFRDIPVVVAETGWPTAGGEAAGADNAMTYNWNVMMRASSNFGTPKRPGIGVEVFLFDLFDENEKKGSQYEKHFGIFRVDGAKAYDLRFN
ncbi:glucan endo-1,3-beta-glucosidase-like [Andrographis paniculata]|uniref:glucan endo-1,3-beta-glucosidase-like n=1 Tax=Andrographis paniculata TaxID=175694 RepID=UPI0021E746F3|nr:glucan endo-1,3-beta-glucosidase-like [Andrographis paniculata]